jgi:CheY-like chemotaxis protein
MRATVKSSENQECRGSVPPSASSEIRLSAQELAGALHEVSNALTVVLGWLEVAQQHTKDDRSGQAVEIALRQARFGHRVARRAIGASVPRGAGEQSLDVLVAESLLAVRPLADARGVNLASSGSSLPEVFLPNCDAAEQILINLLLNAIAFTPEGKTVTVSCTVSGQRVCLEVCDQGPGIDAVRAKTFWDAPVSTRRGGAGVGLPYCRSLASENGADLRLCSNRLGGAFELEWPLCARPENAPSEKPVIGTLDGLQILLVEDDRSICSLVELAFECQGSQVVSANTVSDLRHAKLMGRFDLALVDLSPFGQDIRGGLEMIRQGSPRLPMILITGSAAGLPDGEESSFAAWVRKPFEPGELIETVRRVVAPQSSTSE